MCVSTVFGYRRVRANATVKREILARCSVSKIIQSNHRYVSRSVLGETTIVKAKNSVKRCSRNTVGQVHSRRNSADRRLYDGQPEVRGRK